MKKAWTAARDAGLCFIGNSAETMPSRQHLDDFGSLSRLWWESAECHMIRGCENWIVEQQRFTLNVAGNSAAWHEKHSLFGAVSMEGLYAV